MSPKYEPEIRLNRYGSVDVEYYREQAEQLRAEAWAGLWRAAVQAVREFFGRLRAGALHPRIQ